MSVIIKVCQYISSELKEKVKFRMTKLCELNEEFSVSQVFSDALLQAREIGCRHFTVNQN